MRFLPAYACRRLRLRCVRLSGLDDLLRVATNGSLCDALSKLSGDNVPLEEHEKERTARPRNAPARTRPNRPAHPQTNDVGWEPDLDRQASGGLVIRDKGQRSRSNALKGENRVDQQSRLGVWQNDLPKDLKTVSAIDDGSFLYLSWEPLGKTASLTGHCRGDENNDYAPGVFRSDRSENQIVRDEVTWPESSLRRSVLRTVAGCPELEPRKRISGKAGDDEVRTGAR